MFRSSLVVTSRWFRSLMSALQRLRRIRVAIAWRLGTAFAAVAILAAAANYIGVRGDALIRTIGFTDSPSPEERASPAPGEIKPEPLIEHNAGRQGTRNLEMALDRFETAVIARTQSDAEGTVAQLEEARANLQRATAFFETELDTPDSHAQSLRTRLQGYRRSASAMISLSDQRRASCAAYAANFEAMNARMKESLDNAWRIFGRVVARQSLMQLSNELDEIRRRFSDLTLLGASSSEARAALMSSEQTFAKTLRDNERSLARSQGEAWVRAMHTDLEQIGKARTDIERIDREWHKAEQRFADANKRARDAIADAKKHSTVATQNSTTALTNVATQEPTPPTRTTTTIAIPSVEIVPDREHVARRRTIAWLTAAVLTILLAISLSTVLSIVRPVRRMMKATEQLARGELQLVPRGGIKELDTLAVAFNRMAAEVTASRKQMRDHQSELETRIEQRTQQLQDLASQDPLTLLPNRRQFFLSLDAALAQAANTRSILGVFFLDVDNFKNINDSMGHEFGDRVLIAVAERLKTLANDLGFAARLGGDEFTVVVHRSASIDEVHTAGHRIVAAFQKPLSISNRELVVSVSIGASVYPDHEQSSVALLRAADVALFHAKALGRSQLAMFEPPLLDAAAARFSIEQDLRRAIECGEFELLFQPEIRSETLRATIVEALIRWRMPDGSLASPGEFLAVAEESGLIVPIGEWVMRAAIRTAADWHHGPWPDAKVAINVSPRQLLDGDFVEKVCALLRQFRVPARCIEIELTENVLQTGPHVIETLRRLRSHGIAIALDDFGTGYSSLSSLEQLPLTRIKLDRSLIARIDSNARSAAIVRAIAAMCADLGLELTAEGIEREAQLRMLVQHRAMYLQGYLLSKPVPQNEVLATLENSAQRAQQFAEATSSEVLEELTQRTLSSGG